jgi:succinoglycan biosynthesis protein ExoO
MSVDVSVIIAAYNAEDYLAKSIESVLSQEGIALEVVLVDDGSTDNTLEIMKRFATKDSRVNIVQNCENIGLSAARNQGMRVACGEWVTPLDADDWYGEGRLARLLEAGRRHGVEMVADDQFLSSAGGHKKTRTLLSRRFRGLETIISTAEFIKETRVSPFKMSMGYIKPLIRRDFMLEHSLGYNENLQQFVDWELWMRCLLDDARLLVIGIPGYYYVYDIPGSVSKKKPARNVALLLETTDRFIEVVKRRNKQEALLQLEKRKKQIQRMEAYLKITSEIKSRRVFHAISSLCRAPAAIPQIMMLAIYGAWVRIDYWLQGEKYPY